MSMNEQNSAHSSEQSATCSNGEQNQQRANSQSKSAVNGNLQQLLARWRRQVLQQQLILFLPTLLIILMVVIFIGVNSHIVGRDSAVWLFLVGFSLGLVSKLLLLLSGKDYREINLKNLLSHLNAVFEVLEDSTQLLLRDKTQLSPLEKLQYTKIEQEITEILRQQSAENGEKLSPNFAKRQFITSGIVMMVLLLVLSVTEHYQWLNKVKTWYQTALSEPSLNDNTQQSSANKQDKPVIKITSQQVSITAPRYSLAEGQAELLSSNNLDIDALVGSTARWTFNFSEPTLDYYLVFSNGERQQLIKQKNARYTLERKLTASMVYHLTVENSSQNVSEKFSDIHRIKLTADQAPKIRFISPKNTVTEYGKNSVPVLTAQVQIFDDFAITEVKILASIAKGSGEGVKFRDQNFSFDREKLIDGKQHYFKDWSLLDLGMEPGDEMYFTILASDNRQPSPQQTRSSTKIIRWLEEEQGGINADGILIDFMPEYFKSQRQIIIETIELIEDKADLQQSQFVETSELLGVAQSALKEKYGQYLGDEFEGPNSVGVTFDETHSANEQHRPTIQVHDEAGGSSNAVITGTGEEHEHQAPSHDHGDEAASSSNSADRSGAMALINRYGHNHEDSDVGVMTSQDPRALMKKSLTNMWQAELHLMLSEPELALPFEQQALKLLKLAKKAERIYVKRLGFEPPPVTEQRRYQGEQGDILVKPVQVSEFQLAQLSNQTQVAFRQLLQVLNQFEQLVLSPQQPSQASPLTSTKPSERSTTHGQLSDEQIALVVDVKQGIFELVEKRPALVEVLAVLERILLERQLSLSQCQHCITLLAGKLEQLLPSATASPASKAQDYYDQQPLVESYGKFLRDNL
ncbi:MAG: hypothetical protein ACPG52_04525 [Cognaticolwellia sp.]